MLYLRTCAVRRRPDRRVAYARITLGTDTRDTLRCPSLRFVSRVANAERVSRVLINFTDALFHRDVVRVAAASQIARDATTHPSAVLLFFPSASALYLRTNREKGGRGKRPKEACDVLKRSLHNDVHGRARARNHFCSTRVIFPREIL